MSRRAQKKVSTFTSGSWSLTSSTNYLYDGWNLIREIQDSPAQTINYIWGLDLSGSLQGAGGIGGLLARVKDNSVQNYTYDGNGNVSELLNSDGSVAAHYEYDPYGNTISGAGDNPFRISTKYLDAETGLYYYGYRYYSPVLGRWLNRDPIGESGGLNVCVFSLNNPINRIDILGLIWSRNSVLAILCSDCKGREAVELLRENSVNVYMVTPITGKIKYFSFVNKICGLVPVLVNRQARGTALFLYILGF